MTTKHTYPPPPASDREARAQKDVASRIIWVGIIAVICFSVVAVQVLKLALLQNDNPSIKHRTIAATERGAIYDRNGVMMAVNLPAFELYADPAEILDPHEAAEKLAGALVDIGEAELLAKLTRKTRYVQIDSRLSPKKYADILNLGIAGVHARRKMTRIYPNDEAVAHLLGAIDKDGNGIAGLELGLNETLKTSEDVRLSIDLNIQAIVREELVGQINRFEATAGVGVVMEIKTGEIVAMVSLPDYDANYYHDMRGEVLFNRASKGLYELGSTFKVINTAIALETGTFTATDMIDVVKPLFVGRYQIRDYHPEKIPLNVAEVLIVSSNKGSARIADTVGAKTQRDYFRRLGLLDRLDLDITEVASPLIPARWGRVEVMTLSYGHGISVSPVHLVAAVATITGDGTAVIPTLRHEQPPADYKEQIFSPETARQVRAMMRKVVSHPRGTGNFAEAKGYLVAGKTGTAEKAVLGGYDRKANITSFVGVFPAHQPRYVTLAIIYDPKGQKHSYGYATAGWVTAPVVGRIIYRIAPLLGIHPVDHNSPEIRQSLMLNLPRLEPKGVTNAAF